MSDQNRILIDTSVWLDNYIPHRSGHATAARLLSCARSHGIQLLYAAGCIKDVYYIVAADFKANVRAEGAAVGPAEALVARQLAWSCIENMREIACAVGVDEADVWLASKYRALHDDFEDDLVLAAAKRCEASCLVTSDARLIEHAPVPALSPKSWLALHEQDIA